MNTPLPDLTGSAILNLRQIAEWATFEPEPVASAGWDLLDELDANPPGPAGVGDCNDWIASSSAAGDVASYLFCQTWIANVRQRAGILAQSVAEHVPEASETVNAAVEGAGAEAGTATGNVEQTIQETGEDLGQAATRAGMGLGAVALVIGVAWAVTR